MQRTQGAPPTSPALQPGSPLVAAAATALPLLVLYALVRPLTPDLPAQVARAEAASRGAVLWWGGWHSGLDTPPYSLLGPSLSSWLGVRTVGVLATVLLCLLAADLVRDAVRPRAGAVALALACCANLWSSRLTFAAGMAVALGCLVCLRRGRPVAACLLAALSGLVSPLAALCVALGLGALLLSRRGEPAVLVAAGAAAVLPVAAVSLVLGQPSVMPYGGRLCLEALLTCAGVLLAPVPRTVRVLAGLSALLALGAWLVPSPIGSNATRMPMLLAAALVVAYGRRGSPLVPVLAAALAFWPVQNLAGELQVAAHPSSRAAFYDALLAELPAPGTATQRVEVVDPKTHGASQHVAARVPLARGWERQADAGQNGLFYAGPLDAASYRRWLDDRAVGWVAVPRGPLDYAAVAERDLVLRGLPYLQQVWADADWRLYRVRTPAPAATGVLRATALTDTGVRLEASRAGSGQVRLTWSRLLTVRSDDEPRRRGCVRRGPRGGVLVDVPGPGRWTVQAEAAQLVRGCPPEAVGPG